MKRLIPRVIATNFEEMKSIQESTAYVSKLYRDFHPTGTVIGQLKIFEAQGADEIQLVFAMNARYQFRYQVRMLELVSAQLSTPLAVGGGIKSFDNVRQIFDTGVEKVIIGYNPGNLDLIQSISSHYGAQAICLSLDYRKSAGDFWMRRDDDLINEPHFLEIPLEASRLGVGEIALNCIDRDGTRSGLDCDVVSNVAQDVRVPLLMGCGAGKIEHFEDAYRLGADGVVSGWYFARKDQGCEQVRNRLLGKGINLRAA